VRKVLLGLILQHCLLLQVYSLFYTCTCNSTYHCRNKAATIAQILSNIKDDYIKLKEDIEQSFNPNSIDTIMS